MTYGNVNEIWIVAPQDREIKNPPEVFTSERAAKAHAKECCGKTTDYVVYYGQLIGHMVQDEPRWIEAVAAIAPSADTSKAEPK
jgi:hypothetical protein